MVLSFLQLRPTRFRVFYYENNKNFPIYRKNLIKNFRYIGKNSIFAAIIKR